jgi:hypothetical protein
MVMQHSDPTSVTIKNLSGQTEDGHSTLFQQFLSDTGLSIPELEYITSTGKDIPSRKIQLFSDKNGDVHIPYLTVEGHIAQYPDKHKLRDFVRVRLANPIDGKGKYSQPRNSGTLPYFTPGIIKKYKEGQPIKNLFIIEGEKKAIAGWKKLDLDFIAIGGIHSTKDTDSKNDLHLDIKKLINNCHIRHLVLFFDADALSCNFNPNNQEKNLHTRAYGFFRSITRFKELCASLNVDIYFCHILPSFIDSAKGLDDLLLLNHVNPAEVKNELESLATREKKFTSWFNVSGNSNSKLKEYFGLDNAENFYNIHRSELKDYIFKLHNNKYQSDGEQLKKLEEEENYEIFWTPVKNKEGITTNCNIDHYNLIQLLNSKGFSRMDIGKEYYFIQIHNNLIEEVNEPQIIDFFKRYIERLDNGPLPGDVTKEQIRSKFYKSPQMYISKPRLSLLTGEVPVINRDRLYESYVYFKNGCVLVTPTNIDLVPYETLPGCVYKSQVKNREFKLASEECHFKQFVYNIAGKSEERFLSLRTMLGYLLHDYYDYKLKAINLTDSKISDADEGRTGKTLVIRSLEYLNNYVEIGGKTFDATNKHRYQGADKDTQIIHINDARKGFKLEYIFNDITDGVLVDKKNEKPFTIQTKIAITSNQTLVIDGASARDRIIEFEVSEHYSDKYRPENEFGEWFFRDWDEKAWHAFDNFMINCLQLFLSKGIIASPSININERKLINETHPDFVEFIDDKIDEQEFLNIYHDKKKLHQEFLSAYEEHRNDKHLQKQTVFTKSLKQYAKYRNLSYDEQKSGPIRKIRLIRNLEAN